MRVALVVKEIVELYLRQRSDVSGPDLTNQVILQAHIEAAQIA